MQKFFSSWGRIFSPVPRHQHPIKHRPLSCASVLLLDVQRQRGWRHQSVAAAAARHHGDAVAAAVSMETASYAAIGRGGRGRGGGRLLELLLVDLALFGPAVLEPDLHLEQKKI